VACCSPLGPCRTVGVAAAAAEQCNQSTTLSAGQQTATPVANSG
jgi:hypothetical protein